MSAQDFDTCSAFLYTITESVPSVTESRMIMKRLLQLRDFKMRHVTFFPKHLAMNHLMHSWKMIVPVFPRK